MNGSDQNRFDAYFLRSKCYFDDQDMEKARRDAEIASQLRPESADVGQLLQTLKMPSALEIANEHRARDQTDDQLNGQGITTPVEDNCSEKQVQNGLLQVKTTATVHKCCPTNDFDNLNKSVSPADCSSDSGNQADIDDRQLILASHCQSLDETEL